MLRVFVIPKYKKHVSKGRGAGRQEGEGVVNKTTPIEHEMNKHCQPDSSTNMNESCNRLFMGGCLWHQSAISQEKTCARHQFLCRFRYIIL